MLALAFFAVLSPPDPVAANSQVAVILFFCSIAAVVPGPWQQPLLFISSHKDTLVPVISFFVLRLLLVIVAASLLQKLLRFDVRRFASLSAYAIPAMSLSLLVDHSSRQPVIDALSLSSATSHLMKACSSVLPASYRSILYSVLKLEQHRNTDAKIKESVASGEENAPLYFFTTIIALLILLPILWAAIKRCIASLNSATLQAIVISQLSATFVLPRVPELRSSVGCVLCVVQLLSAPYLRHRSLPFPTEKNRRMFIVCAVPIAMAYSSEGVELSVLLQTILDVRAVVVTALNRLRFSDSSNSEHCGKSSIRMFFFIFLVFLLASDILHFRVISTYVAEVAMRSFLLLANFNLTFISMFVLTWGANYDAGFPLLLVVVMTLLLPSLTG